MTFTSHSRRRRRPSSKAKAAMHCCLSLLLTLLHSKFITVISAHAESPMLRHHGRRNLQSTLTIPPFKLELGYIITSHADPSTLLTLTQQQSLQSALQSSLTDHLSSYYNTISLTNVTITATTFLPQSTDTNLQRTICTTATACQIQNQLQGGTSINTGAYPFKGCFRRKNNDETVLFGTGGSVDEMSMEVLNDNLVRVFCYQRVGEGELVRRDLGVSDNDEDGNYNVDEGSEVEQENSVPHRRLSSSSVQSAKLTITVNGGQLIHNTNGGPTGLDLRDSILNQITTTEGQRAITTNLQSVQDPTLTTLLTDLTTLSIANEQPTYIEERYQSVRGCPRNNNIGEITNACVLPQHSSRFAVHCCSGTLGINLTCRRPNCRSTRSHSEAVAHCANKGMRLCTVAEVESNQCCDGGCGFNFRLTWTLDVCTLGENPTSSPSSVLGVVDDEIETGSPTTGMVVTGSPTGVPSKLPTASPLSLNPTASPVREESVSPTSSPTREPFSSPSNSPVTTPITLTPTLRPSRSPIASPTVTLTISPIISVDKSPSNTAPTSSSSPPTFSFRFPTLPPISTQSPTTTPSLSPSTDPNPLLPVSNVNIAQPASTTNNNDNNSDNIDSNNNLIIAFASAGSLILALAIGLGFFAMRKHNRTHHNKDPSALETTFNQSDFGEEEMSPSYNYDDSAAFYPSSLVEGRRYTTDHRRGSRFGGIGGTFGTSPVRSHKYGDGSMNNNSMWKDQPLSCQDGNGKNATPIDVIVDDMALDFLAGTGNNNKTMTTESTIRDFRPKLLSSVVAPFKAFEGEDTEEDDSDEVSKTTEQEGDDEAAPIDFRPKLMDTSFEALQGEDIDVDSEEESLEMDPKMDPDGAQAQEFAPSHDSDGEDEEEDKDRSDPDGHLILGDIYKAAKMSRREREGKGRGKPTLNDKVATDLRVHRAKMNSFLDDIVEPEVGRKVGTTNKISNHHSLPQRLVTPMENEDVYTDNLEYDNVPHPKKKKVVVPPRFGKRNRVTNRGRALHASPDRRFFTFEDDDDESDEYEDKSRIPNLIMADDKSGFASAVSSIGQLDWRGRERADRRARAEKRKKQRYPSVDTMETEDAGANTVACQNRVACQSTLNKTKNILSETLERSLHCKTRVVSPTSDINDEEDDDDDDNHVSRPWKTKWESSQKAKSPPPVEDAGYQSSNYDPDSDWDVDDNDLTVDYSAEGSFMPSPLKGVGFDLKR